MRVPGASRLLPLAWWAALLAAGFLTRPYLPVDETRYLAVAWEMHTSGDYLVPHLNGALYGHKPPLMFWLIDAGWALFGISDWWPRLIVPAFALLALWLTGVLARALFPQQPRVADLARLVAGGALLWALFSGLVMFDLMLCAWVLLALLGVVHAQHGGRWRGFALMGLGLGLAVLTKGPAALLHVLPAALLAPWWSAAPRPWRGWYLGVLAALLLASAIALAWALPAAMAGGEAFREEILWRQSAARITSSFAHRQPWWWYLPMLPVMLFPWLLWPPVWRALAGLARAPRSAGVRFLLAWSLPALAAFSAISGKNMHYLLPEFPAFALLAARGLALQDAPGRGQQWPVALVILLSAAALALVAPQRLGPLLSADARPWLVAGIALCLLVAAILALARPARVEHAVALVGSAGVAWLLALHLGLVRPIAHNYDVTPFAQKLRALQEAGRPLAHLGKYHGQFQFAGRLAAPVQVIDPSQASAWAARHPRGFVVGYAREKSPDAALFSQPYRGRIAVLWPAAQVKAAGAEGDDRDE